MTLTKKTPTVSELFESKKDIIQAALPRVGLTPERMIRIAMTELRQNETLGKCDPMTLLGSVMKCAQLGLVPGSGLGQAYLVPFWSGKRKCYECQVIPGYRGLMDLASRSGLVSSISSHIVYDNDLFEYELGLEQTIKHKPVIGDRGEMVAVYAVAKLKDGGVQFEVMSRSDVEKVKNGLRKDNPVWKSHFDEMARKTAVRRLFKYLPVSTDNRNQVADFTRLDDDTEQDNHVLIDKTYEPEPVYSGEQTTIEAVYEEGKKESGKELFANVEKRWSELLKSGWSNTALEKATGAKAGEIEAWNPDQLAALLGVLNGLEKKK